MTHNKSVVSIPITIFLVALVALSVGTIFWWSIPNKRLSSWNQSIVQRLEKLKSLPPENVTLEKWKFVVSRTQTAFPNVFYSTDYILDHDRFRTFQRELHLKLNGDVDISTIDWIWDEFQKNSRHGDTYSAGCRPLPPYGTVHLDVDGKLRE